MARLPKVKLVVGLPKGVALRGTDNGDASWDMGTVRDAGMELAKDIVNALRATGYECKLYINREVDEEY